MNEHIRNILYAIIVIAVSMTNGVFWTLFFLPAAGAWITALAIVVSGGIIGLGGMLIHKRVWGEK